MPRFRAVLFDLCDTLVHFDAERLPLIEIEQHPTRSTARAIYDELNAPPVSFDAFFACLKSVTSEIATQRERDHREVTSQERFRRVLERLGLAADPASALRLVQAHMTRLAQALVTPGHHEAVLSQLAGAYRLGIVTNFDHAPTVREVLARDRLDRYFETVVISGEIGWRKPHRELFERAIAQLAIRPSDALFVGDNFLLDVVGASSAGLHAVWYARGSRDAPPADFEAVTDLSDLDALLGRRT